MHIFNMCGTCLQSIEMKYRKPLEELISQTMHYQPLLYISNGQKMTMLKNAVKFVKNYFFIIIILHAHLQYVWNMSAKY